MNRNDVIDVLSVVAAATRRTIGETDVDVWQAVIGDLSKDLALQAVRDHLKHRPGVWLEPGHVYEGARAIRRDQLNREPIAYREARQEALAAKVAESAAELAAGKVVSLDPPKYTRRPQAAEMRVKCPWCKATPGRPCVVPRTEHVLKQFHPSRTDLVTGAAQ